MLNHLKDKKKNVSLALYGYGWTIDGVLIGVYTAVTNDASFLILFFRAHW